mmetsp:Transcript_22323/g.40278  ORF Transcript_22323/g.40278 Transcript_22323/m.40278 type:complete len:113 (+) Transcript_22323:99-437(+)
MKHFSNVAFVLATLLISQVSANHNKVSKQESTSLRKGTSAENEETDQGPWPSCYGTPGDECKEHILDIATDLLDENVNLYPPGTPMTMDYLTNRVRILVDKDGIVSVTPGRG